MKGQYELNPCIVSQGREGLYEGLRHLIFESHIEECACVGLRLYVEECSRPVAWRTLREWLIVRDKLKNTTSKSKYFESSRSMIDVSVKMVKTYLRLQQIGG
jgi:hypothetical protein